MSKMNFMRSCAVPVALALSLTACASGDKHVRAGHRPGGAVASVPSAAAASVGQASASVWRLRAGLNVAALTCKGRGRTPVAGEYRKLLSRHRTLLAEAYRQEQRRLGQRGFDREQTRVYNRYANQRSPQQFCQTAADVARSANRMDSARLAPAARGMVASLDRRLR